MEPIKNILVCLDLSNTDKDLLTYARFIVNAAKKPEKIYFINVLRHFYLPKDIHKDFPHLEETVIKERKEEIRKDIDTFFSHIQNVDKEIIVAEGSGLKTLLKVIDEKEIDLVLIGRKNDGSGHGVLTLRMGRRCPVTLFIIPQGCDKKIAKELQKWNILIPVDFSNYALIAVQFAVSIAKNYRNTEIFCQHVYSVLIGYHYTGKTHDEFAEIMKQNAKKKFKIFIKGCDCSGVKINDVYTLDDNENVVEDIHNYAKKINATGIIFSSKGMTATSSIFLGSTAEKLIKIDPEFPLLVVRKAGDYKGFMHLIKNI